MRQYYIDEISFLERDNIESYLKRTLKQGPLDGVFWLELPADLHGPEQHGHEKCGPFYFSFVLEENSLRCDFLVRSADNLHCSCISYATEAQRDFLLKFVDRMLVEEKISA